MKRILIVEDDDSMATALQDGFSLEGYDVTLCRDGEAGLGQARSNPPDVMVLDVMLPKLSGLDVCRTLRAEGLDLPIIMLTARSQEIDKVLGLKIGADDYVTKPFGFLELLARVEAVLRRAGSAGFKTPAESYRFGEVTVQFKRREVRKGGALLELSPREFQLLRYLIEHRGEVVERDDLLDAVWGYDNTPLTRTVDVHVGKLRRKIEDDPADPQWIVTVHRVGYRFNG